MEQLKVIRVWWLNHVKSLESNNISLSKRQGYKVLFGGNQANDKLQKARMLGKEFNKEVHRVDLSKTVSKYIGETEKNLTALFKEAENKDWILFFDEADALFGKRTKVEDAHDKYANQEVSYLLQKMEEHHGLVILAVNTTGYITDAFRRRFNTVVHFPLK